MALFAIADLHLSFGAEKPMSIFGEHWDHYEERMMENWNRNVTENDIILLCGDISWATYLKDTVADFAYINKLNGKKYILKGNHDYWWTTLAKMSQLIEENQFKNIYFLQNNCYSFDDIILCGTRGWIPFDVCNTSEDKKIYHRELERFELSLKAALHIENKQIIAALHYPPDAGFRNIMQAYGVSKCIFGHLHAKAHHSAPKGIIDGIEHILVSCDYLMFMPKLIVGG